MQQNQQISAQIFGSRFKSKAEIYRFITLELQAYLPSQNVITLYFISDLLSGKKKVLSFFSFYFFVQFIKGTDVKHTVAPMYESISCEAMFDFAKQFPQTDQYFPSDLEKKKLPRQWVVNVLHSLLKDQFKSWIFQRVEERNRRLLIERQQQIEIQPSFLEAFNNSSFVSSR